MALCITATVTLMGASLMAFADYQIDAMQRARQDNVAMAVAEAGANAAFAVLKTSFANKDNASLFPATSYNGGSYDATVTSVGSDKAQIRCVGISGSSTQTVIVDVRDFSAGSSTNGGGGSSDPTSPWGQSVFVNGVLSHNGSGKAYGNVRCNQNIQCNGSLAWGSVSNPCVVMCSGQFSGNGTINIRGSLTAPQIQINGSDQVQSKTVAAVPQMAMPTLDLTPYYNLAVANSQVYGTMNYNGTQNFGTIPGGVRWYNGTLSFNGSVTFAGCVIATSTINFNGTLTQTKVGNLPAIVSRDSSVNCNGSHTVRGLVYSMGPCNWNGSGSLNGALIVGGNLTFNGSYGNLYYEYSMPSTGSGGGGGSGGSTNPVVGVTAWQK